MASEFAAAETVTGVSKVVCVDHVALTSGTVGLDGGSEEKFAGIARPVPVIVCGEGTIWWERPSGDCDVACC